MNKLSRIVLFLIILIVSAACKKSATMPSVSTSSVTGIVQNSAYSGGRINGDGGAHITSFGVCWSTLPEPTVADSITSDTTTSAYFISHVTGLTPNTLYYLKAYATNSVGTAYGDQLVFTTDEISIPDVATATIKSLTLTTAQSGGSVTNDGGVPVTARGVCWNSTGNPTISASLTSDGSGSGLFMSTLTDLTIGSKYYVRAYATNSLGTAYGSELVFTQIEPVTDHDGNAYSVVTIGTQVWMAENLKTTTLNDGTPIINVTDNRNWSSATIPAYCWYNNDAETFKSTYGALYNWYAVNSGKLCPAGWHVPFDSEFDMLVAYLGGDAIAGGKMKEVGTAHWTAPNIGANNGSGFTAIPAGGRYNMYSEPGLFFDLGVGSFFWSATEAVNKFDAYSYDIVFNKGVITKNEYEKLDGESVRCIKNSR